MAIRRLSDGGADQDTAKLPPDGEIPEEVIRKVRSGAIEWATGLLLHEVSSPVGLIASAASREVPDYEKSQTKHHIDSVQRIFDGIEQLRKATATPKPVRFDLAELIARIIAEEGITGATPYGPRPLTVVTDPNLLRFAISNGLRNAGEAIAKAAAGDPHPVVITWGETDVDYWVVIIDRGPGLVGPVEAAFRPGHSTKPGHPGFGLAIARQAMETLGGLVNLSPGNGVGARYELRWGR
jgi:signal transduction histidine kinase